MPDVTPGDRITTKEFYEAQARTQQAIFSVKEDLMKELNKITGQIGQVDTNKSEIDRLRQRSDVLDTIVGIIALIAGLLGVTGFTK